MLIRIVAPHFVAGVDTQGFKYGNLVPPILVYMRFWAAWDIIAYCHLHKWEVEVLDV